MITLQIIAIAVLILLNGLLVLSEMAIVSSRRIRLRHMAANGNENAQHTLGLLEDPADFLSALQVGVTLIGVMAGAFGGATIAGHLSVYFKEIDWLAPYSEPVALGLVITIITYFSLVFGELAPKNLAMAFPERIAVASARPVLFMTRAARPLVRLLTWSTHLSLRIFGFRGAAQADMTEEEVKLLIEEGTRVGALEPSEEVMMKRIIRLGDRDVSDVMTPRTQILALDINDTPEDNLEKIRRAHHSHLPVYNESKDEILGMASVKSLFVEHGPGNAFDLSRGLHTPLFMPESMPVFTALEEFKRSGKHIAVVVDEYGGTAGLVTIIDILEAIVGDVPDADDIHRPEMLQRRDGSWLVGGMVSIDDFKETLNIKELAAEEEGDFQSVAGLVLHCLGRIPNEGDEFQTADLHFEVLDMDGRRVDKLLVRQVAPGGEEGAPEP